MKESSSENRCVRLEMKEKDEWVYALESSSQLYVIQKNKVHAERMDLRSK